MRLKPLACQLFPTVLSVLLLFDPVSARMGLLNNCDFQLNRVQVCPGSFQFYSDWSDPPSWITYMGKSISSHPATRHFWLFIQVHVDGTDEIISRAHALRQDLEGLFSEAEARGEGHLESSLMEELWADFHGDVQTKGGYFEIIVVYHPQEPFPNPRADFQIAHPQAVYFYLLLVYNVDIWGVTDLMWSDFPVAATLSSFTATADEGRVILEWTTLSERQNLGFDILRREVFSETFMKVNEQLIPAASGGDSETPLHYCFVDQDVSIGVTYEYRLEAVNLRGERTAFAAITAAPLIPGVTPAKLQLFPNTPNPFNGNTEIGYQISQDAHVTMSIYDIRGELVKVLVNEPQRGGRHLVIWDGRAMNDHMASSGLYVCALQAADDREAMKMILLR